jgi:ribosome modulation factor
MKDIFEDYMGVQYREGQQAFKDGKAIEDCPYGLTTEMGSAWLDGFQTQRRAGHFVWGEDDVEHH